MISEMGLIDLFILLTVQSGKVILIYCMDVQILCCAREYQILDI